MTAPKRIQRRRTKGWRMPEGAVYVGRPTKWGNPFTVEGYLDAMNTAATDDEARRACVDAFRDWLNGDTWAAGSGHEWEQRRLDYLASIHELAGYDLACWCPLDQPCHADVLLEFANTPSLDPCATCGGPGANPMNGWHCSACRPVYQHRGDLAPQTGATR